MKFVNKLLAVACSFCLISSNLVAMNKNSQRNLNAIILPDDGTNERIGGSVAILYSLREAVNQQTTPIIVSGSILNVLIQVIKAKPSQQINAKLSQMAQEYYINFQKLNLLKEHYKKITEIMMSTNKKFSEKKEEIKTPFYKLIKKGGIPEQGIYVQNIPSKVSERIQTTEAKFAEYESKSKVEFLKKRDEIINRKLELEVKQSALMDEFNQLSNEQFLSVMAAYKAGFSFNIKDWSIYKHTQGDLYVLIPNKYEQSINADWKYSPADIKKAIETKKITERELKLGLTVEHSHLHKINTMDELEKLLSSWNTYRTQFLYSSSVFSPFLKFKDLEHLKSLFVTGKEPIFGSWNIYIEGHGENVDHLKEKTGIKNRLTKFVNRVRKPRIAGLTVDQFKNFLHFLHAKINTNSFYWSACFAGGYHAEIVNKYVQQVRKQTKQSFDLICRCLTNSATYIPDELIILYNYNQGKNMINFPQFFNALSASMQNKQMQIQDINQAITATPTTKRNEDLHNISSIPLVCLSNQNKFAPLIPENVMIIDAKSIQNKKTLDITNKKAILLNVNNINIPVNIDASLYEPDFTGFVPMDVRDSYHHFSIINNTINSQYLSKDVAFKPYLSTFLLYGFLHLTPFLYDHAISIDTLNGIMFTYKDHTVETLKDVFIHSSTGLTFDYNPLNDQYKRALIIIFSSKDKSGKDIYLKGTWNSNKLDLDFEEITKIQADKEKNQLIKQIQK